MVDGGDDESWKGALAANGVVVQFEPETPVFSVRLCYFLQIVFLCFLFIVWPLQVVTFQSLKFSCSKIS